MKQNILSTFIMLSLLCGCASFPSDIVLILTQPFNMKHPVVQKLKPTTIGSLSGLKKFQAI